ncbi:MAG: hypothetical protein AB1649_01195 [Chloroflexota bacterium]
MIWIIIAFAILLKCFYEMTRLRFRPTLLTLLIAAFLGWAFSASPSTVVLAQQPTETPTAGISQSTGMYITVITDEPQINVRMGPASAVYPVVGILLRGATAPALGRSPGGDWVQIEFPGAPNNTGWVYAPLVSVSPGTLRIVEPPPTPVPPPTATIDPTLAAQYSVQPSPTRLPTFTQAPPLTVPIYTERPALVTNSPIPLAGIVLSLGALGLLGFIYSLFSKR